MDDLAYPLKIDKHVRAVLFAAKLSQTRPCWSIKRVLSDEVSEAAQEFCSKVDEEQKKQNNSPVSYAESQIKELREFGEMLQRLLQIDSTTPKGIPHLANSCMSV